MSKSKKIKKAPKGTKVQKPKVNAAETDQVNSIIDRISKEHSHKKFGYLDRDDLINEIWVICLEAMKEYKVERGGVEHFLRVTVRNRMINRFKDITKTVNSPCPKCPFFRKGQNPDCARFKENKIECELFYKYKKLVDARNALLNSYEYKKEGATGSNPESKFIYDEVKEVILNEISPKNRRDFENFLNNSHVPKAKLDKISQEIRQIAEKNDII